MRTRPLGIQPLRRGRRHLQDHGLQLARGVTGPGARRTSDHFAQAAHAVRRRLGDWLHRCTVPLRRRYYAGDRPPRWASALTPRWRRRLGLDDQLAIGSRRLEIGCGPYPRRGYIHVDINPSGRHLEAIADAVELPFPDRWANEILAIHSLEHVHPKQLLPALREWRRVLIEGGKVRVHVPNCRQLMQAFLDGGVADKWRIMGALLGMYCGPQVRQPGELRVPADHQVLFDADVLRWALVEAGFREVEDLSEVVSDRHTEDWADVVPRFSLVMEAIK